MTTRMIWTELKLATREPLSLLMSLAFPIMLMALLAGSFGNAPDPDFGGTGGTDFYVPIYTAATVAVMGFLSMPTHLAGYRQNGVSRRFRAAGIGGSTVIVAQAVVMAAIVTISAAAMFGVGFAFYDLTSPVSVAGVAVGLSMGIVGFVGIGALLGAVAPTARAAQAIGLLLFFGLFFLAGGGPPPALLPDSINTFIDYTPMGPLVSAIGDPWNGQGWNTTALVALGAIGVVGFLSAQRLMARASD